MLLQPILLGIVQGISEFLPISSDGHLILAPALLGWQRFGLGFDVALHLGTLIATVGYFRSDVLSLAGAIFSRDAAKADERNLAWTLVWATIPSVIIALALESAVDGVESLAITTQMAIVGGFLLLTAATLVVSELLAKRWASAEDGTPRLWKALAIGTAQGFAVAPGLSRSGTTIATGVALGLPREQAARFSFLLSIPIVTAATAKKLILDVALGGASLPPLATVVTGVAVTAVVGYAAIAFLLPFVRKHTLLWFAAYTAVVGVGLLWWQLV